MPSARCSPVPLSPICAPVTSGGPSSNPVVLAAPPLHLDHVRAAPCQQLRAGRARLHMREVEDSYAFQSLHYWVTFFFSALCGLRLPMLPDSLPAAGSITALMSVGLPLSIAAST